MVTLKAEDRWMGWYGGVAAIILVLVNKGTVLEYLENNECQPSGDEAGRFVQKKKKDGRKIS